MAEIPALDRIVEKWQRRSAQAGPDYDQGVSNPRRDWQQSAAAANNTYRDAVTAAAQAGAYAAGVQRAGTAKWQTRAKVLGTARFGPGVAAAADDYSRGFAPIREGIAAARLSPRGPRRDPRNRTRLNEMLDSIIGASQQSKGTARGYEAPPLALNVSAKTV